MANLIFNKLNELLIDADNKWITRKRKINIINYLIDNWLFVENNCSDKKFLLNTVNNKDDWWRSFFIL